jgi:AraC family transcriptional regulator of adaptative response/methylated-DNA-[protein]-cysteine methyltransferase
MLQLFRSQMTMHPQDPYRQPSLFGGPLGTRHPEVSLVTLPISGSGVHPDGGSPSITYGHVHTRFGLLTLASADGCIVHAHLGDTEDEGLGSLRRMFANGGFHPSDDMNLTRLVRYLDDPAGPVNVFRVAVTGTPFQLEVWRALLSIPFGGRVSYAELAAMMGRPDAVRAVGTAVGRNPVAFLIPCHRVVRTNGGMGGYMWGVERKWAMLEWEASMG